MKHVKRLLILMSVFVLISANAMADSHNGKYIFDVDSLKDKVAHLPNEELKTQMIEQMKGMFSSFFITIEGDKATTQFGPEAMKGTLSKISNENGTVKFKFEPLDPELKAKSDANPIFFRITGGTLVAGPDNPKEQLQFKKSA